MTKEPYVKAMQDFIKNETGISNVEFITLTQLSHFMGKKKPDHVRQYVKGVMVTGGKYYFIREVASRLMEDTELGD